MRLIAFTVLALALATSAGCGKKEAPTVAAVAPVAQPTPIAAPPKATPTYVRDHYARLDDCVHDWGAAHKCTPVAPAAPGAKSQAAFFGPLYVKSYRDETQVQLRKEALEGGYAQRVASDPSDKSIAKSEVKS